MDTVTAISRPLRSRLAEGAERGGFSFFIAVERDRNEKQARLEAPPLRFQEKSILIEKGKIDVS